MVHTMVRLIKPGRACTHLFSRAGAPLRVRLEERCERGPPCREPKRAACTTRTKVLAAHVLCHYLPPTQTTYSTRLSCRPTQTGYNHREDAWLAALQPQRTAS